MTLATARAEPGRQVVTLVELDLDYCQLTYGTAPCTAAIGVTGSDRCFNTRKTCQDAANYDPAARTYRFSDVQVATPSGSLGIVIPSVKSVSNAPTKIDPGRGLGVRSSVTVTLNDHPWADRDVDRYARLRSYDPEARGTYWGKLLARNPYYNGRVMRVRTGYLAADGTLDTTLMVSRTYVIDKIEGPSKDGTVKISGADVLRLTDREKAQAPVASPGSLLAAITDVATSATLTPAGSGASYAAAGTVAMGEELATYTRSGDVLTFTARGVLGTTAEEHGANEKLQECLRYDSIPVRDIIEDLCATYAGIDAAFIPTAEWDAEADDWLSDHVLTTCIAEPTGVGDLLKELSEQCLFSLWWDERAQALKLRALHPERDPVASFDDASVIAESVSVSDDPKNRISQVWVAYGLRSPLLDSEELKNYSLLYVTADLAAEATDQYDESRVRTVFSRWFTDVNLGQTITLGARLLSRYRDNPRTVTFTLDAKDSDLFTGDICDLTCREIQDATGDSPTTQLQVLEVVETKAGHQFKYTCGEAKFDGRYAYIGPDTLPDYGSATQDQLDHYAFIAPDSGTFADGTDAYRII